MHKKNSPDAYITNLSRDINKDAIKKFFADYGELNEINVRSDRTWGIVVFDSVGTANKARKEMNGKKCMGQKIKIGYCYADVAVC